MQHIEELKDLSENLVKFKNSAIKQLDAIDFNTKEFHKTLIDLLSRYPEQKDILEFTVYINDRIEMNQVQFKEVVKEILQELVRYKQDIIKSNIQHRKSSLHLLEDNSTKNTESKEESKQPVVNHYGLDKFMLIKDIKTILMIIMAIVFSVGFIFAPEQTKELFQWFKEIFII